eukprot:6187138-Pleurochrysis_carterae.AAC.7
MIEGPFSNLERQVCALSACPSYRRVPNLDMRVCVRVRRCGPGQSARKLRARVRRPRPVQLLGSGAREVPYITTIRTGSPSIIPAYREIAHNFIIANYASQEAIDTDDGSAYYYTHDNFFAYAANGLKSDFGGHHNHHQHNVYAWVTNCWGRGNGN